MGKLKPEFNFPLFFPRKTLSNMKPSWGDGKNDWKKKRFLRKYLKPFALLMLIENNSHEQSEMQKFCLHFHNSFLRFFLLTKQISMSLLN